MPPTFLIPVEPSILLSLWTRKKEEAGKERSHYPRSNKKRIPSDCFFRDIDHQGTRKKREIGFQREGAEKEPSWHRTLKRR